MIENYVLPLEDISNDTDKWGGKATSLWKIQKYGLPVPTGIVLHTDLFMYYKKMLTTNQNLNDFKQKLDLEIRESVDTRMENMDLIFRSSANIEGSNDICCSGVFDSYLCNRNNRYSDVAIMVWNSAMNSQIIRYLSHNINTLKMAVLIQPVCVGELSGVMQTCNVVNGTNDIVIEYCVWRLEAVVDGTENSEHVIVTRRGDIIEGIWNGKIKTLEAVCDAGKKIESILGDYVEIEFVISGDDYYILQARRIKGGR